MRKLAKIVKLEHVLDIPNADFIQVAKWGGWQCVIRKGEFAQGDFVIALEVDSWVPHSVAPFLSNADHPVYYNGIHGNRLRTKKMRGVLSQGLLLPLTALGSVFTFNGRLCVQPESFEPFVLVENTDVSSMLGVTKWEPPVDAGLAGDIVGKFPSFLIKTDLERIQNLSKELADWQSLDLTWEVTEKLDGSSCTVFVNNGERGVCSRNLQLHESESNAFWRAVLHQKLLDKIESTGRNLALQGELVGPKIQGNRYALSNYTVFVYSVFDIDPREYLLPHDRRALLKDLDIETVPLIDSSFPIRGTSMQSLIDIADGTSALVDKKTLREGLAFKCNQLSLSFKAISNNFLLKGGN